MEQARNGTAEPDPGRLMRLDIVRGLAVAEIILVHNPGSDDKAYGEIRHAEGPVEHRSTSSFRPFYFPLASR